MLKEMKAIIHNTDWTTEVSYVMYGIKKISMCFHSQFQILSHLKEVELVTITGYYYNNEMGFERLRICSIQNAEQYEDTRFSKIFIGKFIFNKGKRSGKVDKIYVHKNLVELYNLGNGDIVKCFAVYSRRKFLEHSIMDSNDNVANNNETKYIWEWKIIKVLEVIHKKVLEEKSSNE